jgi:TonB family protein
MAATQTPPSPPESTTEPHLDRLPTRYDGRTHYELLEVIDDLEGSRLSARVREAIWISLILHLVFFWWFFYGPRPKFMHPAKVINPMFIPQKNQQMTYLEMPPDLQKEKPKHTNIISDQNHVAKTKNPTEKPKTPEQLQAMRRAGLPAPPPQRVQRQRPVQPQPAERQPPVHSRPAPPAQGAAHAEAPAKGATHAATPPPSSPQSTQALPSAPSASLAEGGKTAKNPSRSGPSSRPTIAANQPAMSVGEQIRRAEQNAVRSNGQGGQNGANAPVRHPGVQSNAEILSDTMGVDFGPYLKRVVEATRQSWYLLIPEVARPPLSKKGKLTIDFLIMPDGSVKSMKLVRPSGDVSLDRAAWGGITGAAPFPPLPKQFKGPNIALRFTFIYNEDTGQWERQP